MHLVQCSQQGQVLRWEENVIERKLSWTEVWNWSTSRLSFLVRSTYDVLPSPVNLVRWKISVEEKCICGKRGTLKHILSNCSKALDRYTWRHNEVLKILYRVTKQRIEQINSGKMPQKPAKRGRIPFARPGQKSFYKQKRTTIDDTSWNGQWVSCGPPWMRTFLSHSNTKKARYRSLVPGKKGGDAGRTDGPP